MQLRFDSVFDAIAGKEEAADLQFRADMMCAIRELLTAKKWSQAQMAEALGMRQPHVSDLLRGKISKFSSDKLIKVLDKLGHRVQLSLVKRKATRAQPARRAARRESVGA